MNNTTKETKPDLTVGQLKKQLENVPDDAQIVMESIGHYAAPMNDPTDQQLKISLAKMLTTIIEIYGNDQVQFPVWKKGKADVKDTELLHVCWLVEKTLTGDDVEWYSKELCWTEPTCDASEIDRLIEHSSWQERAIALAKVKGVEL